MSSKKKNVTKIEKINLKNKSDVILLIVFALLFILVITLLVFTLKKHNDNKKLKDMVVVPIVSEKLSSTISFDLPADTTDDIEYEFVVANYNDKGVATKKTNYNLLLDLNGIEADVKIYKNGELINLEDDIDKFILKPSDKQEDNYKVVVSDIRNTKEDAKINININS